MLNMKVLNDALLWAIADYRRTYDHRDPVPGVPAHDQDTWGAGIPDPHPLPGHDEQGRLLLPIKCPTSACLAGGIVISAGGKLVLPTEVEEFDAVADGEEYVEVTTCVINGEVEDIERAALDLLNIDDAGQLFFSGKSVFEVVDDARLLAAEFGKTLHPEVLAFMSEFTVDHAAAHRISERDMVCTLTY